MRVGLEEPGVTLRIVRMESLALQWYHMGYKSGAGTEKDFTYMDWQCNFLKEKEQECIRAQFQFIWLGS